MANKRWIFGIFFLIIGLFAVTYIFGWIQALRLANNYYKDAEAAYTQADYLNALTGYKEFDAKQNKYVQRGGYLQVERIWDNLYAWPRPAVHEYAQARIRRSSSRV